MEMKQSRNNRSNQHRFAQDTTSNKKSLEDFFGFDQPCTTIAAGGECKISIPKRLNARMIVAVMQAYNDNDEIDWTCETQKKLLVSKVRHESLKGYMYVDSFAYQALNIFCAEKPGCGKKAKEGYSVFGILDHTMCLVGQKTLKKWMLNPLTDVQEIEHRHECIDFIVRKLSRDVWVNWRDKLKGLRDMRHTIVQLRQKSLSHTLWIQFLQSLEIMHELSILIKREASVVPQIIQRVAQIGHIGELSRMVRNVLDVQECKLKKTLVVNRGVSDQLDNLVDTYESLERKLANVAMRLMNKYPALSSIKMHYIPQIGYVVEYPLDDASSTSAFNFVPSELEFQFHGNSIGCTTSTHGSNYYKSPTCRELDQSPGDVYSLIQDSLNGIFSQLLDIVLDPTKPYLEAIQDGMSCIGDFDCILSLALCVIDLGYTRPILTNDTTTNIVGGRHPLQEHQCDAYIANDFFLNSNDRGNVAILTGENGSGKSVQLFSVGLIHYLAQIGFYVPATHATLGIVTKLFTRIHSMESSTIKHSSFRIDCNQLSFMLANYDSQSLLLIDEFGKGTAQVDGVALLVGVVQYLGRENGRGVRAILTTNNVDLLERCHQLHKWKNSGAIFMLEMASSMTSISGDHTDDECDAQRPSNGNQLHKCVPKLHNNHQVLMGDGIQYLPPTVLERSREILASRRNGEPVSAYFTAPPNGESHTASKTAYFISLLKNFEQVDGSSTAQCEKYLQQLLFHQYACDD